MAAFCNKLWSEMDFVDMVEKLVEMAEPKVNDERQTNYCRYINTFLSHFGGERCMVVGSTQEKTRLRMLQDQGDYDYMIISEIVIPSDCLEHVDEVPCFVYIDGTKLQDRFQGVELAEGKYLPTSLLKDFRPEAFKHSRNLLEIFSTKGIKIHGENSLHLDHNIKVGMTVDEYDHVECQELEKCPNAPKKDLKQILHIFIESLNQNADIDLSVFGKVISVLKDLKEKTKQTHSKPRMYHMYGPLIDALSEDNVSNLLENRPMNTKPDLKLHTKEGSQDSRDYKILQGSKPDTERKSYHAKMSSNDVLMKYKSKSHKDFVPAFLLAEKPMGLEDWKLRKRHWPTSDVVDDIWNSEFYVVAKPAIVRPNESKDFSLSYNIAELKLAKAISVVQRKVILILKALQKSFLCEFEDDIKTFHWKNVVYWVSESHFENPVYFEDTEQNLLLFLQKVLEYMTDALCKQELEHYFIPSNLFAAISADKAFQILPKIVEIQENPVQVLRMFFAEQSTIIPKFDVIPRESVQAATRVYLDPSEEKKTKEISRAVNAFATSKNNGGDLTEAITDIMVNALPYLKEEFERDEDIEYSQGAASLDEIFNSFYRYLSAPNSDKSEMDDAKKQFVRNIWSLDPKSRKK